MSVAFIVCDWCECVRCMSVLGTLTHSSSISHLATGLYCIVFVLYSLALQSLLGIWLSVCVWLRVSKDQTSAARFTFMPIHHFPDVIITVSVAAEIFMISLPSLYGNHHNDHAWQKLPLT